jgi:hypothetical protein
MIGTGELPLPSGRIVRVQELRQRRVYEGLLEGLPTESMPFAPRPITKGLVATGSDVDICRLGMTTRWPSSPNEHRAWG